MKTVLLYGLFGTVAFSLAAGGSWLYLKQQQAAAAVDAENEPAVADPPPVDETATSELPVAVAGTPMTAEEIFRIGATYRSRQEAIAKREAELEKRELRFQLIQKDIQGQQRELDGLLAQIRDTIAAGEKTLSRLQQQRAQLESDKREFEQKVEKFGASAAGNAPDQAANLKQLSALVQGMQADAAAQTLAGLINDGKISDAVHVIRGIEQRNASKILDSLPNDLRGELIEAYKAAPLPAKPVRR